MAGEMAQVGGRERGEGKGKERGRMTRTILLTVLVSQGPVSCNGLLSSESPGDMGYHMAGRGCVYEYMHAHAHAHTFFGIPFFCKAIRIEPLGLTRLP